MNAACHSKNIAQTVLALLLLLSISPSPARADMRDDILDSAKRCNTIADDKRWLDCYYGMAQPMRAKLGLVPAPQAQQQILPPPRVNRGFFATILGEARVADVSATVASYGFNGAGLFTVTLSNGQVWAQREGDDNLAKWSGPASSLSVKVSPGAFGTFNLIVAGESHAYKVKRVR